MYLIQKNYKKEINFVYIIFEFSWNKVKIKKKHKEIFKFVWKTIVFQHSTVSYGVSIELKKNLI